MKLDPRFLHVFHEQPHPLLFVSISGAHLYGFPSPDSDYDLRGVHILPTREAHQHPVDAHLTPRLNVLP